MKLGGFLPEGYLLIANTPMMARSATDKNRLVA